MGTSVTNLRRRAGEYFFRPPRDDCHAADPTNALLSHMKAGAYFVNTARAEVVDHLHSEFSTAAIWCRIIEGSGAALRRMADAGLRLGVVSNADGTVAQRLREQEILHLD